MNVDDLEGIRAAVATIRAAMPDVQAIYRFGSMTAGTAGPDSDLDLAVLGPHPLDPMVRFDLQEQLASVVRRSVDLVDLRAASPVMAMHLVRVHRLGVPQETREAFDLLERAGHLDGSLANRLRKMDGFRNVAVHDYQKLNLDVVRAILVERLDDFLEFTRLLLRS